ncbi:DUF11 domain-containing protein [Chloroflexales bacterium ZM16-3]|nr:DUF11 domain-containing protein [Chloroflexales bacterium ZM16-3]
MNWVTRYSSRASRARWLAGAAVLLIIGVILASIGGGVPAAAQIDNTEPTSPVASIVSCIRSGADLGLPSHVSPQFAISCFGAAWDNETYNTDTAGVNGDATRSYTAVIGFGDGKPDDHSSEPGHTPIASAGDNGTQAGDSGVGAVYGLAFTSGTNPAIPATAPAEARHPRLFMSAFEKRVTRFGGGGPGGIYVHDRTTNTERLYVQIPAVVPGPASAQPGPAGFPNTPGDGSLASFLEPAPGFPYSPERGGVHGWRHDNQGVNLAGKVSLGGLAMDSNERYLIVLNLNNRTVYAVDTWSATPTPQYPLALPASVAACPGGDANFRPFAVSYHADSTGADFGYAGYVCSGETTLNRADLRAGVLRWPTSGTIAVTRVLDFPLAAYDAQRGNSPDTLWQPWASQVRYGSDSTYNQPLLADIQFAEDGSLVLGFRSRVGDQSTALWTSSGADYKTPQGDILRATPNGSGGWNAPSTAAPEYFSDTSGALAAAHIEASWGGLAAVPGTHAGTYGGEVVSSGLTPYIPNSSGTYWFDLGGGGWTAREEPATWGVVGGFGKAAGLGDVELLCVWRAIGDRVWRDTNGNGVQDAGEPDIAGVRLQLLNTSGTVLATVTTGSVTGAGDNWRFYVAPFQSYQVRIDPAMFSAGQPLAGLSPTAANQGGNDATDSDADGGGVIAIPAGPRSDVNRSYDIGLADGGNIRVVKAGPATALPGSTIAYTLVVTNDGPGTARGVSAADTLPTGVSYASASPAPASVSGQAVTWSLGDLAAGASTTITLNATIGTATRGGITNSVAVTTTSGGDSPGDNTSTSTTTIIVPNVWVTKSGTATVLPSGTLNYTLSYGSNGSAAAGGVQVIDTLPAGVSYVSASPAPASVSGNTITWNLGTLASGASGSISVTAQASASAASGATLTNTASISTATSGDTPGDNTGSATTTVIAPNVRVTKTGPATALPGGLVDYTLSYDNNGNAAAAGVQIVDTLPTGATFVSSTPAPTSQSGSTLTWDAGTLNAGASGSIALRVQFSAGLTRGAVLTNGVAIGTSTPGDNTGDNAGSASTTVLSPNVRVTKTGPARVTAGDLLTYTVSYDNTGDAAAAGVQIVDTLPTGATFVSSTPAPTSQSGSTLTWDAGTLSAGASGSIAVVARAGAALADGATLTNGATIRTTTLGDIPTDNAASWDTLVERADVAITKASPTTFPALSGATVTYYLDYANNGPAAAANVVIADTVPSQLASVSWSCTSGCAASGTGSISVSLGTLAAGASGRIVVTGTAITSVAREDFTNMATITTDTPETTTANNTSSVPGAVWTSDLLIIKDAAPLAVAGSAFTATLTIRNQGPAPALNVQVQDAMPAGATFVSSTPAPTSVSGSTLTWDAGTLADLEERSITLTLRADAALDGGTSIVNTATTSGTADRDTSNNTDSSTTIVTRQADLRIVKDGPARVTAGDPIAYTLAYANDGPSDARAVVLTDVLPAGVTLVSASPAPTSVSGSTLTWSLGDLTASQSGVVNVTVSTDAAQGAASITVVNAATITDGGTDTTGGFNDDPNPANDTDDARTAIETSDVLVSKAMPAFAVAGVPFDATLRVENRGPADAANVAVRDFLPPDMTLISATPAPSGSGRWSLGTLASGQVVTITLHLSVPSTTPRDALFVNRVTVDTTTPDRDEGNNVSEASTTVRPNADLRVVKDGTPGPIRSGAVVTYTLDWANDGPSQAEAVVVTDTPPPGFTFTHASPAPTDTTAGVLTWDLGSQDVGTAGQIIVVGTLTTRQASEDKVNTARIASPTDDPTPGNNTDDARTIVQTVDLSIVKDGSPAIARAGEVYTYTLTVANAGDADASAVVVQDTLPASLAFVDATPLPATRSGQTLTWALGTLAPGATHTLTVTALLDPAARGTLTNTATVTSDAPDRDDSNNTSTHTTGITAAADLRVVKDGTPGPIRSGAVVTYTLSYHNGGPALANAVVVTDTLPPGFTLTSASPMPTGNAAGVLTWVLGDVASGSGGTITVVGTLRGDGVRTDRVNVAQIASSTDDPTPGDRQDDHPITVLKPDLGVTKSDGVTRAQPGDTLTYQVVVTNAGLVTATGVLITETPPSGDVQTGDGWLAGAAGTYTQRIPQIAAGQTLTRTMRVRLPNPLPAGMAHALNGVTVTDDGSAGDDPTPEDSRASDDDVLIWGTVGDLIWLDRNQNGQADPGEPGLPNVPLELLDPSAQDAVLAQTTTDSSGGYRFDGLRLGSYAIRIDPSARTGALDGYTITTEPIPVTALTDAQREDLRLDIGLYSPTAAIDLAYLTAERQADGSVRIRWGTVGERNTARFLVQRTLTNQRTADAVTVGERSSLGSAGGDYGVTDASAPAGTVSYWLIEVESGGAQTAHGPASPEAHTRSTTVVYLPLIRR